MMETIQQNSREFPFNFNKLQSILADLIREGVIVVSQNLEPIYPIYLNLKAREICDQIWNDDHLSNSLPSIFSDIHRQLIKRFNSENKMFVIDYSFRKKSIRFRVFRLVLELEVNNELSQVSNNYPCLLFFLEDRSASLQEELGIEQQKYDLTDRETEIFRYLLQTYTYREIADVLQISLNTVKFHAKNIYAKKRSYLKSEKLYFEIQKTTQKCSVDSIDY